MYTRVDIIKEYEKRTGEKKTEDYLKKQISKWENINSIKPMKRKSKNGRYYYLYNEQEFLKIVEDLCGNESNKSVMSCTEIKKYVWGKGITADLDASIIGIKKKYNIQPVCKVGRAYAYSKDDAEKIISDLLKYNGKGPGRHSNIDKESDFEQFEISEPKLDDNIENGLLKKISETIEENKKLRRENEQLKRYASELLLKRQKETNKGLANKILDLFK